MTIKNISTLLVSLTRLVWPIVKTRVKYCVSGAALEKLIFSRRRVVTQRYVRGENDINQHQGEYSKQGERGARWGGQTE